MPALCLGDKILTVFPALSTSIEQITLILMPSGKLITVVIRFQKHGVIVLANDLEIFSWGVCKVGVGLRAGCKAFQK